jgi:hypothetical protein
MNELGSNNNVPSNSTQLLFYPLYLHLPTSKSNVLRILLVVSSCSSNSNRILIIHPHGSMTWRTQQKHQSLFCTGLLWVDVSQTAVANGQEKRDCITITLQYIKHDSIALYSLYAALMYVEKNISLVCVCVCRDVSFCYDYECYMKTFKVSL